MTDRRRSLPSVDRLLRLPAVAALGKRISRSALVRAVREAVANARADLDLAPADETAWAAAVSGALAAAETPTLRRCVNATGVVLHTNLGRAPLAPAAVEAMRLAAQSYGSLEYDVAGGTRGSRHVHCAGLLTELTGAADAMVVNNAASALVLALAAAAEGGEVIVSRGELIEIGGGFRIPEILKTSGARLVEVGTTNRTRIGDYEKALGDRGTGGRRDRSRGRSRSPRPPVPRSPVALLKVHRSNFRLVGFTEEAELGQLADLGRKRRIPVLYDLGGGLMVDLSHIGLDGEPTLADAIRTGVTAVVASGDKLLGGPQAGLLLGTRRFIAACRAHPFARAARADKLTLAALAATLAVYRDPESALREIPVLRMITAGLDELEDAAEKLALMLPGGARPEVVESGAAIGGGAYPGIELESWGVALDPAHVAAGELAARLRAHRVPVIAVISGGRVVLDVRSLLPGDEREVVDAVTAALGV